MSIASKRLATAVALPSPLKPASAQSLSGACLLAAILPYCAGVCPALADERPVLPPGAHYFEASAYSVQAVSDRIVAIGEPAYYQNNFSYLLVGDERALILDGGASREDSMRAVVASLTDKPVAVIPSHLHYDHTGGIETFDEVLLIDLPFTRGLADTSGITTLPVEVDLHDTDGLPELSFRVDRYVAPDEVIDLGGLAVQVLWTGGHTRDEVVLWVPEEDVLLSGDLILPEINFVGNMDDLRAALERLIGLVGEDTRILGAHGAMDAFGLPELTRGDLRDALAAFEAVRDGRLKPTPVEPNEWLREAVLVPVNDTLFYWADMVFINGVPLNYE